MSIATETVCPKCGDTRKKRPAPGVELCRTCDFRFGLESRHRPTDEDDEMSPTKDRKMRSLYLEVTPDQDTILRTYIKENDLNRSKWIREAIAERYKRETGKDFPPEPVWGGDRSKTD